MTAPSLRTPRGFTLVELLLALLMTAMLAGGLYQTLHAGSRAQRQAEEVTRLNQVGRAVLDILRRDLACVVQEQSPFNEGLYGENGEGTDFPADSLSFLAWSGFPLVTSSATVDFEAADRPVEADLRHVEYLLDAEDEPGLVRKTKTCLTCTLFDETLAWTQENLAFEVVGLNFRYWDGSEWQDEWDSVEQEAYPEAIEVTVIVGLVEKVRGEVVLFDEEGTMVRTKAFRTRVALLARPQQKMGAQGPEFGVVR